MINDKFLPSPNHSDISNSQESNASKAKEHSCNPNPTFQLPTSQTSTQGIIPSYLLKQAQQMRAQKGEQGASKKGKNNEKLSSEMRKQRTKAYFPSSNNSSEKDKNK